MKNFCRMKNRNQLIFINAEEIWGKWLQKSTIHFVLKKHGDIDVGRNKKAKMTNKQEAGRIYLLKWI